MLTGIDTSFFYALAAGRPGAVDAWENRELLTSTLCFFELRKRMLDGDLKAWPTVLEDIAKAVEALPVTAAAAVQAALIAHETGNARHGRHPDQPVHRGRLRRDPHPGPSFLAVREKRAEDNPVIHLRK